MSQQTHAQTANFIWSICNLLRGPYKRNEYRKVILPLTILRRFDCILEPTKGAVLAEYEGLKGKSENIVSAQLRTITGVPFYNLSRLTFGKLLDDPNQVAPNLNSYINAFSPNVRQIFEKFEFGLQIGKMSEKNLLFNVIKEFASDRIDLSPRNIDNMQMGYVFEELIRIGAEQSNEEAGEHFTPREVIKLMVNLLLSPETDLRKSHVVKTIYDPACGTGGMLSVAERYIRTLNSEAQPHLYGQDLNDEAYAVCRADMLIKGEDSDNIKPDCSFEKDGFKGATFDYMLANPPFGVEWKQQQRTIENEAAKLGYGGRFGAGLPRINDGSFLFLQHMISKMRSPDEGGSRIGIVFNGSPLFTGDAGSGESNIRQWIIENDWLEAIVAMPDQLFYNTGISTYIWIITNRKEKRRIGKIQLIDAREFYVKMRKSLGNKRKQIGDGEENRPDQIGEISRIYGNFMHDETRMTEVDGVAKRVVVSKIFDNTDFGYNKITVERPLRHVYNFSDSRIGTFDPTSKYYSSIISLVRMVEKVNENSALDYQTFLSISGNSWLQHTGDEKTMHQNAMFLDLIVNKYLVNKIFKSFDEYSSHIQDSLKNIHVRLAADAMALLGAAFEEKSAEGLPVKARGKNRKISDFEPDPDLRDTENVPLKENIEAYFAREVLPHVPDAWIDHGKTKVGYEIPLNRHFYCYEPPRALEDITADVKALEREIVAMLAGITGSAEGLK